MEDILKSIHELLCRLSANDWHPITQDTLYAFLPKFSIEELDELAVDRSQLLNFLSRFPSLFNVQDNKVFVDTTNTLAHFYLQEQFALMRSSALSLLFLADACIQRFPSSDTFATTLQCLKEHSDSFDVAGSVVRLTSGDPRSPIIYHRVFLSRFFETLLTKLAYASTRWPLDVLQTFLVGTPLQRHGSDLQFVFENNKDVFEIDKTEDRLMVSLKQHPEAASNAAVISYLKKYLWNNLSFTEAFAVPLKKLVADTIAKSPQDIGRYFEDEKICTVKTIFDAHCAQFKVTEDDRAYLALCPFGKKTDVFCDTLRYFYDILYALAVCGHRAVCYSVLMNCVQNAPSSVQEFCNTEYPGIALIDFFQCISQIFDTVSKPHCVSLALLDELIEDETRDFDTDELEMAAVEHFACLLWIVPQGLRIEILELCLDQICDPVSAYCKELYPLGLLEFFFLHPKVFICIAETSTIRLVFNLPRFCPRVMKDACKPAEAGATSLSAHTEDIGDCQRTGCKLLAALSCNSSSHFKVEDDKVFVVDRGCLECLMTVLKRKLDNLARHFDAGSMPHWFLEGFRTSLEMYDDNEVIVPPITKTWEDADIEDGRDVQSNTMVATMADVREPKIETREKLKGMYKDIVLEEDYGDPSSDSACLHLVNPVHKSTLGYLQSYDDDLMQILDDSDDISVQRSPRVTTATLTVPDPDSESLGDLDMILESQNCAKQITEFLKTLLGPSKKQHTLKHVLAKMRKHDPKFLDFCEQYYQRGVLGFLRWHSHVFDTMTFGKLSGQQHVVTMYKGPLPEVLSAGGVISQLHESYGQIFCKEHECIVRFPAWAFLDESRKMHTSLKSVLTKGCYVNFQALKNEKQRLNAVIVTQVKSRKPAKVCSCKCAVIFAGPYYALLEPLNVKKPKGNIPPLHEVTVFFVYPNGLANLKDGEVIDANVKLHYPLPKLWQALQLSGHADGLPSPGTTDENPTSPSGTDKKPTPNSLDEQDKEGMRQAIAFFLRTILKAGNNVPARKLESVLYTATETVQDFCHRHFPGGLTDFFRRYAHAFRLLPDGTVKASTNLHPSIYASSENSSTISKPPSCTNLSEVSDASQAITAKGKHGSESSTTPCVLRGLFGKITGLWEQGAQVTSDVLQDPVNVLPASFVQDKGTVSVIMTSAWHLGDVIEFDAICDTQVKVTCAFRVANKALRETVVPVMCTSKVALVTSYYALFTLCDEDTDLDIMENSVVMLFSYPQQVKLELMQTVQVTALPGYPSPNLWKVLSLLD